ncbi:UNVERIFIED_CONTAM: hypothetical protein FKN15_040315 [Acipenser sinensis]
MSTPALELNPAGSPVLEAMEPSTPPSAQEADPNSAGSPALSPDSSHDATLSVPACSPADSDNLSPDELELLAKLEEQNRLLEADSKSMRSMSGSRRNSGSSLVSSSSASSNLSHLEEDTWILWGRIVNEWEEWRRKKDKLLKELIRKGIPHHFRAIVWQLLGNAADMPVKNQYSELLKMSSPCEKLIRRDIARTYPEHDFFKGQDSLGQEVLFNVMKELIRKGIPHHFRAIVWQLLGNAADMPVKNQYSELLKMSSPCEKLIRRDIARTYPEHDFFKGQDSLGQEVLFNVMKAYSLVDREVGYCQGSAFIVGLLLMQMPEEEAFCVFVRLMQEYRLRELFKPSMAELGLCIYQFEYMLQSFHTSMYASSWFLTLFLTFYPLPVATRIFDIFMYEEEAFCVFVRLMQEYRLRELFKPSMAELGLCIYQFEYMLQGLEIIFRVGMAILQYNQTDLIQLDMEGMSQHFQKVIPHQFESCPDKLILRAYQIKYNPKKMKRLEKEYTTIKNKEMEEQIEIKRLRTENRLLKQRIETLEKGQVTRALEAEENYVIKRELAVVRQQCTTASQSLEKAQDTIRELQEHKGDPRYTAEFASDLQTQLERSRLQEAELLGALREMQDKVLHMEKRNSLLPDENNMAQLQDELKAVKQREMQTLNSFKEMQSQISDLNEHWQNALNDLQDKLMTARLREAQAQAETRELRLQAMQLESQNQINSNLLNRQEVESAALQEKLQYLSAQNKGLQTQLSEIKRKQAEFDCKSKEEVMAVRLREADSMAAVAELRQRIADLEIQKEEGRIQGQLNNSDSSQYIRELKDQIAELKTEIRLQKGHQQRFKDPMTAFDGIHIVNHVMRDGDSLSSDEDLLPSPLVVGGLQDALYPLNPGSACFLRGVENPGKDSDGSTDSEQEERTSAAQLYAHMVCGDNVNNLEN